MRLRAAPAAAAALLLALGAPACKPSSLTPFGIGTRGPESPDQNINGLWQGANSSGLEIAFFVGNETVSGLRLRHRAGGCIQPLESDSATAVVSDDAFSLEVFYTQGRLVVDGVFTSATTSQGSYSYEGLPSASDCPTAGSGTFVANKTR